MARWQIYVRDSLDERLRNYLHKRFSGRVHGKLTQVVTEAVEKLLDEEERREKEVGIHVPT